MANSSKIFILILLLSSLVCSLILFPTTEAKAWEVITGRISSIQAVGEKTQLTILLNSQNSEMLTPAGQQAENDKTASKTDADQATANSIDLEIETRDLPPQLKKGDYIRIWSKPDNQLKPWRISSSRGHDPTGVRSRLQGRGRHGGRSAGRSGGKGGHGGH